LSTRDLARWEAQRIVATIRASLGSVEFTELRLIGTFPLVGGTESVVVDVTYSLAAVEGAPFAFGQAFSAPPASRVSCLDPRFA
jgi:hypothetical protein